MPPGALGLLIPLRLVSFFIYLESNAVILYKFWRPQPSLPCLGLQYSIISNTRTTVSLSSMQVVFAEADMEKLPRDRPITVNEGRAVGCLHQNIFTRKVTDIAFTSDFCNNHSHPRPVRPCIRIWRPASPSQTFPRPILDVPKSLVSRSKSQTVSDLKSPTQLRHTRPNVQSPSCPGPSQFYTRPRLSTFYWLLYKTMRFCWYE